MGDVGVDKGTGTAITGKGLRFGRQGQAGAGLEKVGEGLVQLFLHGRREAEVALQGLMIPLIQGVDQGLSQGEGLLRGGNAHGQCTSPGRSTVRKKSAKPSATSRVCAVSWDHKTTTGSPSWPCRP